MAPKKRRPLKINTAHGKVLEEAFERGEIYAYEFIVQKKVYRNQISKVLKELVEIGLLKSLGWKQVEERKPRKMYVLTEAGRNFVAAYREAIDSTLGENGE